MVDEDEQCKQQTRSSNEWKTMGNSFYSSKEYAKAIEAYTSGLQVDDSNVALLTNRAAAFLMTHQFKDVVSDCDKAIHIEPSNARAYFRKATALKALGNINGAVEALTTGLQHDPSSRAASADLETLISARSKIEVVKEMVSKREFRRALSQLDTLFHDVGGAFRDINILKVECLLEINRLAEAYNLTNTMMRNSTVGDVDLLRLRARYFYASGDTENSVKHLVNALKMDPDNSQVRTFYRQVKDINEKKESGNAMFRDGLFSDALGCWKLAIDADPHNAAVASKLYCNRATALSKLEKFEESVEDASRAIDLDANYGKAYQRRAESHFALGTSPDLEKAVKDFERALELCEDADVQKGIQGKLKRAQVALKRSKKRDLYAILGVKPTADDEDIRKAYRRAALKYHPDKQAGKSENEKETANAAFKEVSSAYEILSDREKRERYDSGVEEEDIDNPHSHGGHGSHHGGIDPNILFQMFMQQQRGF